MKYYKRFYSQLPDNVKVQISVTRRWAALKADVERPLASARSERTEPCAVEGTREVSANAIPTYRTDNSHQGKSKAVGAFLAEGRVAEKELLLRMGLTCHIQIPFGLQPEKYLLQSSATHSISNNTL